MKKPSSPIYTEVQSLKIPVMRIILGVTTAIVVGTFVWKLYRLGWADETLFSGLSMIIFMIVVVGLVESSRIYTRVTPEGIGYRFFPLQFKERFARWEDLREIYIREYSALGEYGGWGLRYGFGLGWGYVAGGNWGVQLEYKNGKKRFISTKNYSGLKAYLEQYAPDRITKMPSQSSGLPDKNDRSGF